MEQIPRQERLDEIAARYGVKLDSERGCILPGEQAEQFKSDLGAAGFGSWSQPVSWNPLRLHVKVTG